MLKYALDERATSSCSRYFCKHAVTRIRLAFFSSIMDIVDLFYEIITERKI